MLCGRRTEIRQRRKYTKKERGWYGRVFRQRERERGGGTGLYRKEENRRENEEGNWFL